MSRIPRLCRDLVVRVSLLFAIVVCLAASAAAQSATGSIEGVVSDQSGAVLPGVTVTVTQSQPALSRSAVTDDQGIFRVPLLPVGALRSERGAGRLHAAQGIRRQTDDRPDAQSDDPAGARVGLRNRAGAVDDAGDRDEQVAGQLDGQRSVGAEPAGQRPQFHRFRAAHAGRDQRRAHRRHQLRRPARHAQFAGRRRRRQQQHVLRTVAGPHRIGPRAVSVQPGRGAGIPGEFERLLGRIRPRRRRRDQRGDQVGQQRRSTAPGSGSCATRS